MEQKNILLKIVHDSSRQKVPGTLDAVTAQRKTEELKLSFENDGYQKYDQDDIDTVRRKIVDFPEGEEANDLIHAGAQTFYSGITPERFQNAIDQAPELSVQETLTLTHIRNVNILLHLGYPDTGQQLAQSEGYPDLEIQRTNAFEPIQNNILIQEGKNILFNKAKEKGREFLKSKGEEVAVKASGKIASEAAKKATSEALKKGAAKLGKAAIGKSVDAALMAALGAPTGGLGALALLALKAIKAIVGKIIGAITRRIKKFIKEHKKEIAALGLGMLSLGLIGGSAPLIIGGSVMVAGFGIGSGVIVTGFVLGAFFSLIRSVGMFFASIAFWTLIGIFAMVLFFVYTIYIITNSGFVIPLDFMQALTRQGVIVDSLYMDVSKTVRGSTSIDNMTAFGDGQAYIITYDIEITAEASLTDITISDECETIREFNAPTCPPTEPLNLSELLPSTTLEEGETITFSYTRTLPPCPSSTPQEAANCPFADTLIIDRITVVANTPEEPQTTEIAQAFVSIGDPPVSCPNGWPIRGDIFVTQGAGYWHNGPNSVDLRANLIPVYATHGGFVEIPPYAPGSGSSSNYGHYVKIISICNGREFASVYAHLNSISVTDGQQIAPGTQIGVSGNSGNTAYHLHYEFWVPPDSYVNTNYTCPPNADFAPYMASPYIPSQPTVSCTPGHHSN